MYQKLEKVLKLVAKTGDKVIVVSEHYDPYVVMSLADYDHLITGTAPINDLTEEQLLGKLNRDIAVWKSAQEPENLADNSPEYDLEQFKVGDPVKDQPEDAETKASVDNGSVEEEDKYYIEPVE